LGNSTDLEACATGLASYLLYILFYFLPRLPLNHFSATSFSRLWLYQIRTSASYSPYVFINNARSWIEFKSTK